MKTADSSDNAPLAWLDKNVARPAECAFVQSAYEPARTLINTTSRAVIESDLLPELRVAVETSTPAKEFSPAYFAQLASSGVVSTACYAVSAEMTSGVLRSCGQAAKLEGTAARLIASQSTGLILGGAIHDGLMDAPDNATRFGHAAMGAVSMAAFEGTNRFSEGQNFVNRYTALALTAAVVGATEAGASQALAGQQICWSQIRSAATASATVSVLLPGAQWGLGRVVDAGNVGLGRGMPLSRFSRYEKLGGQSGQLDQLMHDYPLVRVQPEQADGSGIEYRRSLVHMGDGSGAIDLAHELGHLRARAEAEPQFLRAASLLKTDEQLAKTVFLEARFSQESTAIENEQRTEYDITGEFNAAKTVDFLYGPYRSLFSAEFEKFKTTGGAYRPEHDFAIVDSGVQRKLRQADSPPRTINVLYSELTVGERKALIQAVEEWKAGDGLGKSAFDLTWGMSRIGWEKALTASVAEECAAKLLYPGDGDNKKTLSALPDHPLVEKLTAELSQATKKFKLAERENFEAQREAFAKAGREHEFWEREHETAYQAFRAVDDIAYPRLLRAEDQIMAAWAESNRASREQALRLPDRQLKTRCQTDDQLLEKQNRVNRFYDDSVFPYKARREMIVKRLNQAGHDLENLNPYVFESATRQGVEFDYAPWTKAQSEFAKTFRQVVERVSQQKELTADESKNLELAPHVVRRALTSTLLYGKDASRWWQDRAFWKSTVPIDVPLDSSRNLDGLGTFLARHRNATENHIVQRVTAAWTQMLNTEHNRLTGAKLPEAIEVAAKYVYPQATNLATAKEAFKWGLSPQAYNEYENMMLDAAAIANAFPTTTTYKIGNLAGRFLDRRDPRIPFLGEYTNSCIRLGGANEDGLKWTLQSPLGGFFAVENIKTGKLVAASRVWKVPQLSGVTFNNVESKGLGSRDEDVLSIYRAAAKHLIADGSATVVTMGVGHNDLSIDNLAELEFGLPLPEGYEGMSDTAAQQVLLAGHPEEEHYEQLQRQALSAVLERQQLNRAFGPMLLQALHDRETPEWRARVASIGRDRT